MQVVLFSVGVLIADEFVEFRVTSHDPVELRSFSLKSVQLIVTMILCSFCCPDNFNKTVLSFSVG